MRSHRAGHAMRLRVEVLGPVRVSVGEREVEVPSADHRAVLALLALYGGRPVGSDEIAATVWGSFPPPGGTLGAVRECVAVLRRILKEYGLHESIQTTRGGYRLHPAAHTTDLRSLYHLGREARGFGEAGECERAFETLTRLLSQWREVATDLPPAVRARPAFAAVEQERIAAELEYITLGLRLRRHQEVLPNAERLVAVAPTDPAVTAAYLAVVSGHGPEALAHVPASATSPWRGPSPPVPELVGRDLDVAQVAKLLADRRLLTLVGAAGSGKTTLGLRLAERVRDRYADGVTVLELADLRDPRRIATRILDLLRVAGGPGTRDHLTMLVRAIGTRDHLLVLDNAEHLVSACAELADRLLRACAGLTVLVTSREPMGVPGETVWWVEPLAVPERPDAPAEELRSLPAVQLFLARAAEASPGFALTDANAQLVATVCRRLDGLPLALELAAACLRTVPMELVAERLADRFRLLAPTRRAGPRHHRSLHAALQWSFDCLDPDQQRTLARLSVLGLAVVPEAARAVCGAPPLVPAAVDRLLDRLAETSLLQPRPGGYRMLESVHAFAADRLSELGETESRECRRRLVSWAVGWAAAAGPLEFLPDRDERVAVHMRQLPVVQVGLREAAGLADWPSVARILAEARVVWDATPAAAREALSWVSRLASALPALPGSLRARVEYTWSSACWMLGLRRDAADHCAAAAAAAPPGTALAVTIGYRRADCAMSLLDPDTPTVAVDALHRAEAHGDETLVAEALGTAATAAFVWGDYEWAAQLWRTEWELKQRLRLPAEPMILANAGYALAELGQAEPAVELARQGAGRYPEGHPVRAWALGQLGHVHLALEQYGEARDALSESIRLQREDGAFPMPLAFAALAEVESRAGNPAAAVELASRSLEVALAAERLSAVLLSLPHIALVLFAADQPTGRSFARVLTDWNRQVRPPLSASGARKLAPLTLGSTPENPMWQLEVAHARRSPGAALSGLAQQALDALNLYADGLRGGMAAPAPGGEPVRPGEG